MAGRGVSSEMGRAKLGGAAKMSYKGWAKWGVRGMEGEGGTTGKRVGSWRKNVCLFYVSEYSDPFKTLHKKPQHL